MKVLEVSVNVLVPRSPGLFKAINGTKQEENVVLFALDCEAGWL